jgi:glycosyltransferase involved in cell wall biosynthesis
MAKILVYTQAYNAEKTLCRAINSVLNQTFTDWEYCLVDNGSFDNTGAIILGYAQKDSRIIQVTAKENDWQFGNSYLPNVFETTGAKWFCVLDADDEYNPDFFMKMLNFVSDNSLQIAVAGYYMADAVTGKIMKCRNVSENIILDAPSFAEKFYLYRWSTCMFWDHLFSIDLLRKNHIFKRYEYIDYNDCITVLSAFIYANRVGILADTLYTYYPSDHSLSRQWTENRVRACMDYYWAIKNYLEYFKKRNELNQDRLYSLLLHMHEGTLEKLKATHLPINRKLEVLGEIFYLPETRAMLCRPADPMFHNLAARASFIHETCQWLIEQKGENKKQNNTLNHLIEHIKALGEAVK